jgi:hypothetical protein
MRTATIAEYKTPGTFFPEEGEIEVDSRDPKETLNRLPASTFAFRFVTLTWLTATDETGEEFERGPSRSNVTGWYYPGGELYDYATVAALPGDHHILLSNMQDNGWDPIVRCRTGNWQPFSSTDQLLPVR